MAIILLQKKLVKDFKFKVIPKRKVEKAAKIKLVQKIEPTLVIQHKFPLQT